MPFIYLRSEEELWTVGHYRPDGGWLPESDHGSPGDAAQRVAWLNGIGPAPEDADREQQIRVSVAADIERYRDVMYPAGGTPAVDAVRAYLSVCAEIARTGRASDAPDPAALVDAVPLRILRDELVARLADEHRDRQLAVEYSIAQLNEILGEA